MEKTYQGQKVTVVRPAKQGDQNFQAGKDQSVIRLADGTEKVVSATELT